MTHPKARIQAIQLINKHDFVWRARSLSPQDPIQRADRLREAVGTRHIKCGSLDRRDRHAVDDLKGSCSKAGSGLPHTRFGPAAASPFVKNRDLGRPVLIDGHPPKSRCGNTSQSRRSSSHRECSPRPEQVSFAGVGAVPDTSGDKCPTSKPHQNATLGVPAKTARIVEYVPYLIEENQSVMAESVVVHAQNLPVFAGAYDSNPPFWGFL